MPITAEELYKKHTFGFDNSFGIDQPIYRTELVPKLAASPGEDRDQPPAKRKKQSPQEESYLDGLLDAAASIVRPPLSALGYIGSSGFDAIAGRKVRAAIALATNQGRDKNRWGELLTVPFLSDLVGWTDRETQVTGSDLLGGWDDPDTVLDGVAEFFVELVTDPVSYTPGVLLGAFGKGGKIAKSAGVMDDVTRGLSKKLGRRVGRSEAKVLASLKDAVVWSHLPTKTAPTMSAKLKAKWDTAAIGQGYKDIDDALANIGDKTLGGRIGVTWNPIGDAINTYGTGPLSQKSLRAVDALSNAIVAGPIGTKVAGLFDYDSRDALTAAGQKELREVSPEIAKQQAEIRMRTNERLATLSAHGLDKPEYRDAVIGMVEGSVRHGRRNPEKIYEIAASDRKIDKIIRDNLKRAKHPEAKTYKQWTGYETMKELIKDLHDELAGEVLEHERLGLGDKKYSEIMENYLTRSTKDIGDPTVFRYKPPKAITRDMERRLKKKGFSHQDIHAMGPEKAAEEAGYKWKEAEDLVVEQQKKGQFAGPRGAMGKTTQNQDTSMIRRKEFLKGVSGGSAMPGGTEAINLMAMDSRLSGPLADYARNHNVAAKIIFSEYMGNNPKLFKLMNDKGRYKLGDKFGDMAGLHPHALGKKADDVMDEVDAEILNDSFEAMYSARLSSEEIAGYLRELDPRYAQHQVPLFFDDMPSRYMKGRLGARNTFEMAKAAHRMLKNGMSDELVRGQSLSVLSALREAGFEKRASKRLAAFLNVNGISTGRLGVKNPNHMLAKPGDNVVSVTVRGKKTDLNADWVKHEQEKANTLFEYGASPGRSASRKGIGPALDRLKADALTDVRVKIRKKIKAGTATPKMQALAKRKFKGLRLPDKKLAELTQRATAQGSKLKGDKLRGVLRAKFYDEFIKSGGKVKRVSQDIINDARKSMDLASDPDVTRGFLGVWDKLTNTIKSKLTGEHIPYFLRNMQGLAIMDYIYGSESAKGIVDFVNPKRAYRFYKRWRKMIDFHAGKDIKDSHKLPYFAKTDWQKIAAEKEKLTGVKHAVDDKFKDAVATDHVRALAMASEVAPPHRSSEVLADRLGIPVAEFSTVGELIPGIGRNKTRGLLYGQEDTATSVRRQDESVGEFIDRQEAEYINSLNETQLKAFIGSRSRDIAASKKRAGNNWNGSVAQKKASESMAAARKRLKEIQSGGVLSPAQEGVDWKWSDDTNNARKVWMDEAVTKGNPNVKFDGDSIVISDPTRGETHSIPTGEVVRNMPQYRDEFVPHVVRIELDKPLSAAQLFSHLDQLGLVREDQKDLWRAMQNLSQSSGHERFVVTRRATDGGRLMKGVYNPDVDMSSLTTAAFTDPTKTAEIFLHEFLHSRTYHALSGNIGFDDFGTGPKSVALSAAVEDFGRLFAHAKELADPGIGKHWKSDINEFMSYAFTSPKFQKWLASQKSPSSSKTGRLWDWFIKSVKKMVGIEKTSDALLERVLQSGTSVIEAAKGGRKRSGSSLIGVTSPAGDDVRKTDWSFLNPLEVRGGFMKKSRERGSSQFLPAKVGEWVNDYGDRIGRTATWYGLMEEGVDPVEAALRSNAMHVDYNKLSSFEKRVMRRVVPFYTFQRKMASYFLRDLAQHPGGATANMIRAINVSTGEGRENNFVPQQLAGQLAVPLYRNGNAQAYLKPDLPIEVLNDMFTIGPDSYTTFQNTTLGWAGQLHFIPKAMIETAFGKSTFQKGRRLEDMYSRIGSKDPILNQIVMASPLSRYISMYGPRGTLFDERKTALEKASSLVAGVPIATIDMEKAAREGIRDAINKEVRTEDGVAITERYYIADGEKASDRAKELIKLQNSLANRQRALKKKLAADAERNEQKRSAPPAF